MPDGSHQQIANLRTDVLGKIIGKAGVNITLIKQKSGANVSVLKDAVPNTTGYTKVIMVGASADVYLATQMIQEILVNGPSKLSSLPEKPQSGAPGYPQIAPPAAYKAPSAQGAYPNYADPAASQFGAQPQGQYTQPQYAAQPAPGAQPQQQQQQQYGITQTTVVLNTRIFHKKNCFTLNTQHFYEWFCMCSCKFLCQLSPLTLFNSNDVISWVCVFLC
jgi:hypothetical protein